MVQAVNRSGFIVHLFENLPTVDCPKSSMQSCSGLSNLALLVVDGDSECLHYATTLLQWTCGRLAA